jgi:hypothetical protein
MQDCYQDIPEYVLKLSVLRDQCVISAPAKFILPILFPGHAHMDEDVVGEVGQV